MKSLAAFSLILFSLILYVVLATQFGLYQRYPVLHFAAMAVGLFFLVRLIVERFTIVRLLLNLAGWTLALFFAWWTLSYSTFEEHKPTAAIGEETDVMSLPIRDSQNVVTTLQAQIGDSDAILLAFYRGYW